MAAARGGTAPEVEVNATIAAADRPARRPRPPRRARPAFTIKLKAASATTPGGSRPSAPSRGRECRSASTQTAPGRLPRPPRTFGRSLPPASSSARSPSTGSNRHSELRTSPTSDRDQRDHAGAGRARPPRVRRGVPEDRPRRRNQRRDRAGSSRPRRRLRGLSRLNPRRPPGHRRRAGRRGRDQARPPLRPGDARHVRRSRGPAARHSWPDRRSRRSRPRRRPGRPVSLPIDAQQGGRRHSTDTASVASRSRTRRTVAVVRTSPATTAWASWPPIGAPHRPRGLVDAARLAGGPGATRRTRRAGCRCRAHPRGGRHPPAPGTRLSRSPRRKASRSPRARSGAHPRRDQHQQPGPDRAAGRLVDDKAADQRSDQRPSGQHAASNSPS